MAGQERPFWKLPAVQAAIRRLSEADDLTLIVGAGASIESGFPPWGDLVWRLLEEALRADTEGEPTATLEDAAQMIYKHGPLPAASYAKTLLAGRFESALRNSLYRDVLAPGVAGSISIAAARLHISSGPGAELLTLNYDEQLLAALGSVSTASEPAKAINSFRKRPNGERFVRHVHGRIYQEKQPLDGIVLAEEDYFAQTPLKSARDNFMRDRLDGGPALFVGTSLTDSNLLGYLHSQKKIAPNKHVAIFTNSSRAADAATRVYESATATKWRRVGVSAIQNRMYGQTAQFLHEVRLARAQGTAYVPYNDRLVSWESQMSPWMHNRDPDEFGKHQDTVHGELRSLLEALVSHLDERGIPRSASGFLAIELWSRRPSARSIKILGTTVSRYVEPWATAEMKISALADDPIVLAFTNGARMLSDTTSEASLWGTILAFPVTLDDHPEFARLPVGVLALRSTLPPSESVLSRLTREAPEVDDVLVGPGSTAQNLLDPAGPSLEVPAV